MKIKLARASRYKSMHCALRIFKKPYKLNVSRAYHAHVYMPKIYSS